MEEEGASDDRCASACSWNDASSASCYPTSWNDASGASCFPTSWNGASASSYFPTSCCPTWAAAEDIRQVLEAEEGNFLQVLEEEEEEVHRAVPSHGDREALEEGFFHRDRAEDPTDEAADLHHGHSIHHDPSSSRGSINTEKEMNVREKKAAFTREKKRPTKCKREGVVVVELTRLLSIQAPPLPL